MKRKLKHVYGYENERERPDEFPAGKELCKDEIDAVR
jgi:hypothetical protein